MHNINYQLTQLDQTLRNINQSIKDLNEGKKKRKRTPGNDSALHKEASEIQVVLIDKGPTNCTRVSVASLSSTEMSLEQLKVAPDGLWKQLRKENDLWELMKLEEVIAGRFFVKVLY